MIDPSPQGILLLSIIFLHLLFFLWSVHRILRRDENLVWKTAWIAFCFLFPFIGIIIYMIKTKDKARLNWELAEILGVIIILGFLFSFRQWGAETFNIASGLGNWIKASVLAGIAVGIHLAAQKKLAGKYDAKIHFRFWKIGAIIAIILVFLTDGWFIFAALSCLTVKGIYFERPGRRVDIPTERHLSTYETAKIVAMGPLVSIILAIISKGLYSITNSEIFYQFMFVNILIAIFATIPFMQIYMYSMMGLIKPKKRGFAGRLLFFYMEKAKKFISEGELIFFGSRAIWIFLFTFVIACGAYLYFFGAMLASLLAIITALPIYLIWHKVLEPKHIWAEAGVKSKHESVRSWR